MSKTKLNINDFQMFYDIVHTLSRMSDGVKMSVNDSGLTVYAKNDYSKCELTSNSITSTVSVDFCIGNLMTFYKLLTTVKGLYENDYSGISLYFDTPFLRIESKKFKTKISLAEEDNILNFIGSKVHTTLTPQLEFTTSTNIIKSINGHSFIFNDSNTPRIYLGTDNNMENNTVFATIGNEENDLANSVTLELGLLNYGSFEDRKIILDFNRLNIFNMCYSEEIKVQLAKERPVLLSNIRKEGKGGSFMNLNTYVFLMVK